METIGAYQAKTHLPKLLERVSRGDTITITRHGVPIAVLKPYDANKQIDVAGVIKELRQFRAQNKLDNISIRDMIEEGRK